MTTVYVTVTTEPPGFFSPADGDTYVSIHLAFDGDQAEVHKLLGWVKNPAWKLAAYRYDSAANPATLDPHIAVDIPWTDTDRIDPDAIALWLDERNCFVDSQSVPGDGHVKADSI